MTTTGGRYQTGEPVVRYHLDKDAMAYLYRQMAGHIAIRWRAGNWS